ncbi:MAG: DNA/RNA nuclease SfsA [Eubacteriales bacterium]|nr:DNA/RNA nuclease SfsA [Eubacteriales bacterium]
MRYERIEEAVFRARPNRFVAQVTTGRGEEICHVKNTGRCRELLVPGARVWVQRNESPARKTALDLIAVEKNGNLINMDSQIPNRVAAEWIREGNLFTEAALLRPETRYGDSRIDLYIEEGERRMFLEVKGVTLEEDGVARFPDAPTERGVKHIRELMRCRAEGYEAGILFVIQMKGIRYLEPNDRTHPEFGEALRQAEDAGVEIMAVDCAVTPDSIRADRRIEVRLT